MSVCPFCKNAVPSSAGPCPSCGRRAEEHPSLQAVQGSTLGGGWDDDDLSGSAVPLSRGGAIGAGEGGASSYAGGGLGLGDDDDPFADDVPGGALELDLPQHHTANAPRYPSSGGMPAVTPPRHASTGGMPAVSARPHASTGGMPAVSAGLSGVPDLVLPPPNSRGNAAPASGPQAPVATPSPGPAVTSPPASARMPVPAPMDGTGNSTAAGTPPAHAPQPEQPPPPQPPAPPAPPSPAAIIARFPAPPAKLWHTPLYAMKVLMRQLELRQDLDSLRKRRSPDVPLYEAALKTHDSKQFAVGLALTCAGLVVLTFLVFLRVILRFIDD